MSTETIDLKIVLEKIMAHVGNKFPNKKLTNRLLNLGLDEFVGVNGGSPESSFVLKYGFPFKFNNQLDEGILVLAHFLDRFKREGGSLEIYAINKLSKGQEKDLSFWQDAKARLYLELQNIILLLNKTEFARSKTGERILRRSRIRRIFTFGEVTDLAFLSQSGINVLGEQLAASVDVGFLFLKTFAATERIKPLTNTLIINYRPHKRTPRRHNFYELYGFNDDPVRYDLPYKERCSARWFTKAERNKALNNGGRLREIVDLFTDDFDKFPEEPKKWAALDVNVSGVCRFDEPCAEFFNNAMLMMFKAYKAYRPEKKEKRPDEKFIIDRINRAVITRDMIRLQRAMSSFGDAFEIQAVDATSTKNSLNVHESSPVYRDWLRRSLNRVLMSDDKTLHRIYILDDDVTDQDKDVEYQTLLRLMQFYRDYFHYEVSEIKKIVERDELTTQPAKIAGDNSRKWFEDRWRTFPGRIGIYVTTSTVIEKFAEEVLRATEYPAGFELLFRSHVEVGKKKKEHVPNYNDLAKLDYLYAKYDRMHSAPLRTSRGREMIYNFLNPRADTGELSFPAFTYRDFFANSDEITHLFDFPDKGLGGVEDDQINHRKDLLAVSLLQYADTYYEILKPTVAEHAALLATLREELVKQPGDVTQSLEDILTVRCAFETKLYEYFKPHFDYLYAVLEYMSVPVDFWENIDASSVREILPFRECKGNTEVGQDRVKPFTDFLEAKLIEKLKHQRDAIPKPEKYGLTSRREPAIGAAVTTRAESTSTRIHDVFISYNWASPIKEWVHGPLKESLVAAGLKVLLDKDVKGFKPGRPITSEIERAVKDSSHLLAIMTPRYFEGHSGEEVEIAHGLLLKGKELSVIPFVLIETEMPEWIDRLIKIHWTDPATYEIEWQRLLDILDAPNKQAPHPGPLKVEKNGNGQ